MSLNSTRFFSPHELLTSIDNFEDQIGFSPILFNDEVSSTLADSPLVADTTIFNENWLVYTFSNLEYVNSKGAASSQPAIGW